jgi:hypothetical protein
MNAEILVGSSAVAKLKTDACFVGELGVCYGVSDVDGHPVWGFIFETGRFMVLAEESLAQALKLTGRVCEAVAGYSYAGDAPLKADFRAGRFAPAFPLPWRWMH